MFNILLKILIVNIDIGCMYTDVVASGVLLAEKNDDYFSFSFFNYININHGNKTTPQGSERMMISCDTVCTIIQINRLSIAWNSFQNRCISSKLTIESASMICLFYGSPQAYQQAQSQNC